jgi:hypothetical protein
LLGIPEGGKWFKTVTNFHQNDPKNWWKSFPKNPFSPTTIRFRERIIFWWFSWQFADFLDF